MSDVNNSSNSVLETIFGRSKPGIAMRHLPPLPGRPLYHIREAEDALAPPLLSRPVLANTGVKIETERETLADADGVIVGTGLKRDGYTWNPVDPDRGRRFMREVRIARNQSEA